MHNEKTSKREDAVDDPVKSPYRVFAKADGEISDDDDQNPPFPLSGTISSN